MSRISWGRKARLYVSADGFGNDDLVRVRFAKDITSGDQADILTATARDMPYKAHGKSAKERTVEFSKLVDRDDDGDDVTILENAYRTEAEIYCVLLRNRLEVASGNGIRFLAQVFGWPEEVPENDAITTQLMLKPVDPDLSFERVATPYSSFPSNFRRALLGLLPLPHGGLNRFDRRHLISYERSLRT
jgi:hypothetical protein